MSESKARFFPRRMPSWAGTSAYLIPFQYLVKQNSTSALTLFVTHTIHINICMCVRQNFELPFHYLVKQFLVNFDIVRPYMCVYVYTYIMS